MAETPDRPPASADDALDRVIRSFTDAEIALRELIASAESFRSASATMDAGRGELAASRLALGSTTEGLALLMASVTTSATQLQEAAAALRAVDQPRIWAGFEAIAKDLARHDAGVVELAGEIAARLDAGFAAASIQVISVSADLDSAIGKARNTTAATIERATAALDGQLRTVAQGSTTTLTERIASAEQASLDAIRAAQEAIRTAQDERDANMARSLDRLERRAGHILIAVVMTIGVALAGVIIGLLP